MANYSFRRSFRCELFTRGEHFRRERNQNPRTVAKPPQYAVPDKQTLPLSEIFGEEENLSSDVAQQLQVPTSSPEERRQPEWRKRALSLLFSRVPLGADQVSSPSYDEYSEDTSDDPQPEIPPLTALCLRVLIRHSRGSSFAEDVVPYVPTHLRRVLLRWTTVHAPLSNLRLYALCDPDKGGHIEGELIVVGPYASLPSNYFKDIDMELEGEEPSGVALPLAGPGGAGGDGEEMKTQEWDEGSWDSTSSPQDEPPPLISLALVSTPLPVQTLFTLPPTLTSLALLSLPSPTPIHRLPRLLPLLEVLDLSYNLWLGRPKIASSSSKRGENLLERTEWGRWSRLKVLGLRECGVGKEIIRMVNKGKWVDVEVIGVDEPD